MCVECANVFSLHTAKGMVSPPLWTIKIPSQLIRSVPLCFTVNVSVQLIVECLPMTNIKSRDSGWFPICFSLGVDQVKSSLFFLLLITVEEVWRWQKFSLELFQDGVASLSGQEKEISARPVYSHINHCGSGKNKGLYFPGLAPFPDVVMQIYTFLYRSRFLIYWSKWTQILCWTIIGGWLQQFRNSKSLYCRIKHTVCLKYGLKGKKELGHEILACIRIYIPQD